MRNLLKLVTLSLLSCLLSGCAQHYYALNARQVNYTAANEFKDVKLDYRYDVLFDNGNTKMAKKELKHHLKVVAVRITNNSDKVLNIGTNAAFYSGTTMIFPLDPYSTTQLIKQSSGIYILYLLLTPVTLTINESSPLPIGLLLGPGLTINNMVTASKANKKLLDELIRNDVMHRDIQPGETIEGLVTFKNLNYAPLNIKMTN